MANMRFFFVIALLILRYLMAGSAMTAKNLTTDQSALLAFKAHIISDPQSILVNNWSISNPICNWVGVSCGAKHARVTALNLSDMELGGTIPPHLGNLSFLTYLDLSDNNFQGHLPDELGKLRRLGVLNLNNNNNLKGPLPSFLFNISSMRVIYLEACGLFGSIHMDLCHHLPGLEVLSLFRNQISGTIPRNIINCTLLKKLDLQENLVSGEIPHHIGNLQNLEYLYLGHNKLTGLIPSMIFNISTIIDINLNNNVLTGQLPSSIGHRLPNLERLAMSRNKVSGVIPNSISNASKLTLLELGTNSFSGLIPTIFGNLIHLQYLSLRYNDLTTESSTAEWRFLSFWTNCRQIKVIDIGSNPLYGILPSSIGNFSESLLNFYAYNCKIMGSIPVEVGNLQSLIMLSLSNNSLNGSIPTTVGRLWNLQFLSLRNNNLQGSIPSHVCHLERLSNLWLQGNNLSGSIPSCLASLTALRELQLASNKFSFSIPASLWTLTYILRINLSSNSLTGSLPLDMQKLTVLIDLDLSRNQLSGEIPIINIGGLKDLVSLSLVGNNFKGPIPNWFGTLTSLESLDISNNNFSGEIPKSLEALLYLKYFNVSHNMLEGEIPTKGPFKNFSAQSFMSNYALCGLPLPPCNGDIIKRSERGTSQLVFKYILPPVVSTILIVTIVIVFIRKKHGHANCPDQEDLLPLATWGRTSFLEIQKATNGFSEYNLLGMGSFGSVYQGTLSDGVNVAIKVFNLQLERAFNSFDSECQVLHKIRHRNLIKILSCCCNIDFKALILEFMPNDSLEKWLYSPNFFLDILERLNIMIDVALGLEYLHHGYSVPIVHCDLKPSNILLDKNMVAKVSDFGIAKLLEEGESMSQTMTLATIGYMAPEYGSVGIVSTKGDVYSYGILLMETFSRKKPTDDMFSGNMSLRKWVKESLPHSLSEVADAYLLQEKNGSVAKMDCVLSVMNLAFDCSMESPEQRINMEEVTAKLKKIKMKFVNDVSST